MRGNYNIPEKEVDRSDAYRRAATLLQGIMDSKVPADVQQKLRDWLVSDVSEDDKYAALKELFEGMDQNPLPDRYDYERLRKIQEILGFPKQYLTRPPARRITLSRRFLRVAVVIIPALVITAIAFTLTINTVEPTSAAENIAFTVSTSEGEQKNILLPDSSRVWLNEGTTISYASEEGRRTVYLEGEAYFHVQSISESHFSVKTDKLTATVLGTKFNISAFTGRATEVVLDEGCIEVVAQNQKVIMNPADKVKIEVQGDKLLFDVPGSESTTGWRRGLEFHDTSIIESLASIASHFNMELEVVGVLPEDMIRFGFDHDASVDDVISVLASTLDYFSYRIDPPRIIILTD